MKIPRILLHTVVGLCFAQVPMGLPRGWFDGEAAEPTISSTQDPMRAGIAAFEKGDLESAVAQWKAAAQAYERNKDAQGQADALINLGAAYQSLGEICLATQTLAEAVEAAQRSHDQPTLLSAKDALGSAYRMARQNERAERELREALEMAQARSDIKSTARIQNNLGILLAEQGNSAGSERAFKECILMAIRTTNQLLAAQAQCNAAAAAARSVQPAEAERLNQEALELVRGLSPSHDQAMLFLRVGQTAWRLRQQNADETAEKRPSAQRCYEDALRVTEKIGDLRAKTYALGYLGQTYEADKQYGHALELTREAAFVAQQMQVPDALYRWEWQAGRLARAQGRAEEAIAAYLRAVQSLQGIHQDLSLAYAFPRGSFREEVGPVFFELADLLLQRAETMKDPGERERLLLQARDTVEQLKSAELEDYFQDPCVSLMRAKVARIEKVAPRTAVIYIIPLADRTELLVGLASGLREFRAPVGAEKLASVVRQFRVNLQNRTTREHLVQGRQLYQWLIGPIEKLLAEEKVETLVFVPDGALRTVPIAALHDGEHFLIERFAVAATPGLTLLEPRPISRERIEVLTGGLSQAVQNFPPLPYVPEELDHIHALFGGPRRVDKDFVLSELKKDVSGTQFTIVHLASHGRISRDAGASFILTYDGRLTLDQLEDLIRPSQYRGKPVELLTLSACQTAAGDDRAALGLAGVAVKAGARSALATLWFVNDASTAMLVSEFYRGLRQEPTWSKARALQEAQRKLLDDPRYDHPCYWAPYLMIGNWL